MERWDARKGPMEALAPPGPLSGQISTIKVAMRPPDIPLIEKVEGVLREVKEKGGSIPGGSSLSIRSIDGYVQFMDLSGPPIDHGSILRVIEHDPSRGTFLVGGDGMANLATEASWYCFKALPDHHVVLFIEARIEGIEGSPEVPKEKRMRTSKFLSLVSVLKEKGSATDLGYRIWVESGLDRLVDIFTSSEIGQSKSQ